MDQADIELGRTEAALAQDEVFLHTELAKLKAAGDELSRRAEAARGLLAEAEGLGGQDASLAGRLSRLAVPALTPAPELARARAQRESAIAARRQANQQLKQALQTWKTSMAQLTEKLQQDERAARELVERIRVEAERAKQAKAAKPPPPPRPSPVLAPPPARIERAAPRVRMQATVDLHSHDNFFNGFSANISDGGLFVATVNMLPLGTEVELDFSLPSGERIHAQGVVRWHREVDDRNIETFPGIGVQFTRLEDTAAGAIKRFVVSREPMFYAD